MTEHTPEDQNTLSAATGDDLSAPEAPEEAAQEEASQEDTEAQRQHEAQEDTSQLRKARKEAANYRTRARDAEAHAEALQARVEALEWAELERHLPAGAPNLEGLQKLGLELDEVKDDDGNIDPEKVHEAVTAASELVGVSLSPQPRMPLEGKSPNRSVMSRDVESRLKQALGL